MSSTRNQTLPGFKPVTDAERMQLMAAAPLIATRAQKACSLGLFDNDVRDQLDLADVVLVGPHGVYGIDGVKETAQ